jgi:hypothetical protein
MTRKIFDAPALKEVSLGESTPGPDVRSRDEIRQFTREHGGTLNFAVPATAVETALIVELIDMLLQVHE